MGLTSEEVHWLYGALLSVFALMMLLHVRGFIVGRWPEYRVGGALLLFGLGLVFDSFLHGNRAPADYGAETAQHLLIGAILIVGAVLEIHRAAKGRDARVWRLPAVLALVAAGTSFVLHAQHEAAAPMLLLVTQHRFIAATLIVLALAVLLAPVGPARTQGLSAPLLTLLLGLELLVYSEGRSLLGVPDEKDHVGSAKDRMPIH